MICMPAVTRPRLLRLVSMLGLLLLVGLFAGAVHHHDDGPGHPCAVCTVAHSPAAPPGVVSTTPAPPGGFRALQAPIERVPGGTRLETAPSRAPPAA